MKNALNRLSTAMKSISWPKPKAIMRDTAVTVLTTAVLSLSIAAWTGGIEYIIDWIMSLL